MRALLRELCETVILALLVFLALHLSVQNYRVDGPSMRPTLEQGEYVLVNKLVYLQVRLGKLAELIPFIEVSGDASVFPFHPPRRGEIVVFRFPDPVPTNAERRFVKRIVGVPGDVVEIRQNGEYGQVYVNGEKLEESYLIDPPRCAMDPRCPMKAYEVPTDSYFVLGDNRLSSDDSRRWGEVPAENIIGRAWISLWPLTRWHTLLAFPWP